MTISRTAILSALALTVGIAAASAQPRDPRFEGGRPPPPGNHRDDRRDDRQGGDRDWHRGDRIGRDDWNRGGRIDYREHHLRAPPRGYEWREVNSRYILAAIATGVIADIIQNVR
jgi:Ni/Co efflux regulator RcnB